MDAAAAAPKPPTTVPPPTAPPTRTTTAPPKQGGGDLRHLVAPMSALAAVQMEVAATEIKCRTLQSVLRAGEREMAKLQATIDDARAVVSGSKEGGRAGEALGAEDDDGAAAAAAAGAARRAAEGIWREVAALDARIGVVLHALGEAERLTISHRAGA